MRWLVQVIQVLYTTSLLAGFGYWWYVWQMHSGMPPEDEYLGRWARANPWAFEHSSDPVAAQLSYPLFWILTRRMGWSGFWFYLRMTHLALCLLVFVVLLVLFLATPDVSGFRN